MSLFKKLVQKDPFETFRDKHKVKKLEEDLARRSRGESSDQDVTRRIIRRQEARARATTTFRRRRRPLADDVAPRRLSRR